jgi:hypothetical protein
MTRASLVISVIALIVALGGTAYALGKGSVGSRAVADNALRSADLRDGKAVDGADVADDSLTGADIDETSIDVDSGLVKVEESGRFESGFFHTVTVQCPGSLQALAGGYRVSRTATSNGWSASIIAIPVISRPIAGGTAWDVEVATPNQEQIRVIGYALCGELAKPLP